MAAFKKLTCWNAIAQEYYEGYINLNLVEWIEETPVENRCRLRFQHGQVITVALNIKDLLEAINPSVPVL